MQLLLHCHDLSPRQKLLKGWGILSHRCRLGSKTMDRSERLTFEGLHPETSLIQVPPLKVHSFPQQWHGGWKAPQLDKCLLLRRENLPLDP